MLKLDEPPTRAVSAETIAPACGEAALLALLDALRACGYAHVTPTPASHARVLARTDRVRADCLADVLGWSMAFDRACIDAGILGLLDRAGALEPLGGGAFRSRLRVSALMGDLYLHSAYPTDEHDAVFFGPDSYRFARFIEAELGRAPLRPHAHIVDIGTGAGVGAIVAAKLSGLGEAVGTDVNPRALRLAALNARSAGVALHPVHGEGLALVGGAVDLALANPPYIVDNHRRQYRDGGAMLGGEVSLRMAQYAVERLAPGGRLLLYTGSAIVRGRDALRAALYELALRAGCAFRYEELDPDVFGEELERTAYREVDRIALVGAVLERQGRT